MKTVYNHEPDWVMSPGEIIQDILEDICMTQAELADRMGMSAKNINEIIKGKVSITPETSLNLSRVLGGAPDYWKRMEDLYTIRKKQLEEDTETYKNFISTEPIKELRKRGYIQPYESTPEGVEQVLRFFGFSSVPILRERYENINVSLRHSKKVSGNPLALYSWLRICELEGRKIGCDEYNKSQFSRVIRTIRDKISEWDECFIANNFSDVQNLCASCGVAVVLVKEFKSAAVNGAAKWLSPNKALIMMTLKGKFSDIFWFTFFHEAAHILFGSKKNAFIDFGDDSQEEEEKMADKFASDILIPSGKNQILKTLTKKSEIEKFADSIGIHAGIVVGRLQHERTIKNSYCNDLRLVYSW